VIPGSYPAAPIPRERAAGARIGAAQRSFPWIGRPSEQPRVLTNVGNSTRSERLACREAEQQELGYSVLLQTSEGQRAPVNHDAAGRFFHTTV
jgi:hypothetical protein